MGGFVTWLAGVFWFYPVTQTANTTDGVVDVNNAIWDAVYISSTPAVVVSVVPIVAVSLLTQRVDPPRPPTDVDGEPPTVLLHRGVFRTMRSEHTVASPNRRDC